MLLASLIKNKNLPITISITATSFALFIGLIYLSKPDRGGVARCEEIFHLNSLSDRGLKIHPLTKWMPFENPKFRMYVENEKSEELIKYLGANGYSNWKKGSVQYGSFYIGENTSDEVYYSKKRTGKNVDIMAYDKRDGLLYAITSQ